MRAIILSAGQGRRLLPWTANLPKCLLPVRGDEPVLGVQLHALREAGVREAVVVVGYGADHIQAYLDADPVPGISTRSLYNPYFACSDNLVSCWWASHDMHAPFVLLNGDTLFEPAVVERLLAARAAPLVLVVDEKAAYDADDMKVARDARGHLLAVGKTLDPAVVNAESIGLMRFAGDGPERFRDTLEEELRAPEGLRAWYLSAVGRLAQRLRVETLSIAGRFWCEIDSFEDLEHARHAFASRDDALHETPRPALLGAGRRAFGEQPSRSSGARFELHF